MRCRAAPRGAATYRKVRQHQRANGTLSIDTREHICIRLTASLNKSYFLQLTVDHHSKQGYRAPAAIESHCVFIVSHFLAHTSISHTLAYHISLCLQHAKQRMTPHVTLRCVLFRCELSARSVDPYGTGGRPPNIYEGGTSMVMSLSLIHISEPTRPY